MSKRPYKKNRKKRNTDYSVTQQLIKHYGEKKLYELWVEFNGMYKSAEFISRDLGCYISPYIIRYLSNLFSWKRAIDSSYPIAKGILKHRMPAGYYKHIYIMEESNDEQY